MLKNVDSTNLIQLLEKNKKFKNQLTSIITIKAMLS